MQPDAPRVVVAVDRAGWSMQHVGDALSTHLGTGPDAAPRYHFAIVPQDEIRNVFAADLLVCMWWRALETLLFANNFRRTILCVYDHYSWSGTDYDLYALGCAVKRADVLAAANSEIATMLEARQLTRGKPVFLVEDGVDTAMFRPTPLPSVLTLGWCGNSAAAQGQCKGLPLIREAASRCGVDLRVLDCADVFTGKTVSHDEMPAWYGSLSAYVCASTMEGTPNPVLEAMASGRPVITTRCGLTPRVVQDGVSGFFAERSVEGLCQAIERLKTADLEMMGRCARRSVEAHDWRHKIPAWDACIQAAMEFSL